MKGASEEVKGEKEVYKCQHCPKEFGKKTALTSHTQFVHLGIKPFICIHDGCGKEFSKKYLLSDHIATHTGEPMQGILY